MATEYKLSYTAAEIDEKLGKVVDIDATLTKSGAAADAKAVGDALTLIEQDIKELKGEETPEVLTAVAPETVYLNGDIYIANSRVYVKTGMYGFTDVIVCAVSAGRKYRFDAYTVFGAETAYALGSGVYDRPADGYNTGVPYISSDDKEEGKYSYEIIPETDCYLYVQYRTSLGIDPNKVVYEVTGGTGKKNNYPEFAVSADGNGIEISYPYGRDVLTVLLKKRGGNNLFDFYTLKTGAEMLCDSTTDWHSPFIVAAVDNADGDTPENKYFTGGNHQTNNSGSGGAVTARTSELVFYADGKIVDAGETGHADVIEMRWTNMVQGYNTSKADGSGREILRENHVLTFTNGKFESYVELVPLENVILSTYYGLQGILRAWDKIRYPGGTNRAEYTGDSESGDSTTYCIDCRGESHLMRIELDPLFDLGKRENTFVTGTRGAFSESYGKCYFTVVNTEVSMAAGDMYCLRGAYTFSPA